MAASSIDLDYVLIMMKKIREDDPHAAFCICQGADWERNYKAGDFTYPMYTAARNFAPDVIVMRLTENCPPESFDGDAFTRSITSFLDYLRGDKDVKIILTTSFWPHPADEFTRKLASERNLPLVELSDLGLDPKMKAVGLFEHAGVANHPGDEGMRVIAERILDAYFKLKI